MQLKCSKYSASQLPRTYILLEAKPSQSFAQLQNFKTIIIRHLSQAFCKKDVDCSLNYVAGDSITSYHSIFILIYTGYHITFFQKDLLEFVLFTCSPFVRLQHSHLLYPFLPTIAFFIGSFVSIKVFCLLPLFFHI